jgi:hypothetical protein
MAAGRFAGRWLIRATPVVAVSGALGIAGSLALVTAAGPVLATLALAVSGFGVANLYPVTIARLLAVRGLGVGRGAALGAAASGTAALAAPAAIQALAAATSLGTSFVAVAAVLALVVALDRTRLAI